MDWQEAKDSTLRYWKKLRGSLHEKDEIELLTDINAINDLCQKAKEEAEGRWGRCHFCIAYQQFGGCTGISLRMSESVVDRDFETLRKLVDWFIEQLETLKIPRPGEGHLMLPEEILSETKIQQRVHELAAQMNADYAGCDEILLVGVLRGAFIFLADLSRCLNIPRRVDFLAVSNYPDGDRPRGAVRLIMDLRSDIEGKHVLIVEDIVDTGRTLDYLMTSLGARRPASLKSCALVCKTARHKVPVHIDYLGFEIPDVWVVGYGLDLADRYRSLSYIGVIDPELEGHATAPGSPSAH